MDNCKGLWIGLDKMMDQPESCNAGGQPADGESAGIQPCLRAVEENVATTELLILPDGRIFVHNLTPRMAGLLAELDPADAAMRERASGGGQSGPVETAGAGAVDRPADSRPLREILE
jgi:hypothetical protein